MAGETVGLDLASQTGQSNIESAIEDLADTGGLANQAGQADIVSAIGDLIEALSNVTGIQGPSGNDGSDGSDGNDGVGISSISKTSTSGNVDTYTITLSNGNTATFTVTNCDITFPSSDGTYILQISSGVASWVSVTIGGSY